MIRFNIIHSLGDGLDFYALTLLIRRMLNYSYPLLIAISSQSSGKLLTNFPSKWCSINSGEKKKKTKVFRKFPNKWSNIDSDRKEERKIFPNKWSNIDDD